MTTTHNPYTCLWNADASETYYLRKQAGVKHLFTIEEYLKTHGC